MGMRGFRREKLVLKKEIRALQILMLFLLFEFKLVFIAKFTTLKIKQIEHMLVVVVVVQLD